jgi:uncharacterized cupredoxin-like copper-binding protein
MVTCDAPALPPGSPTPMEATPEGGMEGMATPEGMAEEVVEATPADEAAPQGTPADQAVADEATAAVQNVIACLQSGNLEGTVALFTPNGLMAFFFTENPYDVLAQGMLEGAPSFEGAQFSDVMTYDDGRVSVQVDYMSSQYQASSERWYLTQDEGYWKLDGVDYLNAQPEGDTAVVGVNMTEYAFEPNVASVVQPEVLILHGINAGVEMHEIVVIRLPEGMTTEDFTAAASDEAAMAEIEQQSEFIGAAFFEPGQQGDLALVGLEPGVYTLVCFIPAPDGAPHFAHGMVTQIEVVAPEPVATPAA